MSGEVNREGLQTLVTHWVPWVLALLRELQEIGVDVSVSMGTHPSNIASPGRGEIIIRVSYIQE